MANRKQYLLEWRAKNPDKIKSYNETDYSTKGKIRLRNPKYLLYKKEWSKTNSTTIKSKFSHLKALAKRKNRTVDITIEQFESLMEKPCHYCDGSLSTTGYSLDRIDNALGYHISNVVPCCGNCNKLRNNLLTSSELMATIKLLKTLRKTEKIWN
jgi:hypothetical protein